MGIVFSGRMGTLVAMGKGMAGAGRGEGVMRSPRAKEYNAATRMYGLVESQLMWAMDMAAVGQELQSHLSATLKRVA